MNNVPKTIEVTKAVARVTFFEIARDKILYNGLVIAVLILCAGFLAARMSFVRPERMILDLGVSGLILSSGLISVLLGAGLIPKEFDRRTIHVALARPITRTQFLIGKYFGLVSVMIVNALILFLALYFILVLAALTGNNTETVSDTFLWTIGITGLQAWFLIIFQSGILAAIAIFFSTFMTTSLSAVVTIGVYLIGINANYFRKLSLDIEETLPRYAVKSLSYLFPNFEYFNLGSRITYNIDVSWAYFFTTVLYGVVLSAVFLILASFLIRRRDS